MREEEKRREVKRLAQSITLGRGTPASVSGFGGAGLAGGGVKTPADTLESGELIGVSVTEEISRQEKEVRL